MNLKDKIINYAKAIGVDLIGFTSAQPFEEVRQILEDRREAQYLTGFEEEDIELRIDPRKTLQTAKSIIVIGQGYYIDDSQLEVEKPQYYGELARTAWGKDYHLVLHEKLEAIGKLLEIEVAGAEYKAFVDTGPLVDREVAHRAGLGWYGYNSTLINEEYGSWFFIGYMITNVEIKGDMPLKNKECLGCNLCIEHCPSGAIEAPYVFNGNRCLSCLLQKRTDIAEEDRVKLVKRLYGCDVCQTICPHNKGVRASSTKDFVPMGTSHQVDLVKLLNMSNKEFKEAFKDNASGWRGKKVLQRNAIIALVNQGTPEAIQYLTPLLKDPRLDIRQYAEWGIERLKEKKNTSKANTENNNQ
ncbi:tRNA epoxyqueuosine(34) reductase QueG [Alkaliphilus hydrothermalis]|uniref:Epoxyqueuosine reductase n=1 Tax=Alkaliphilus hydrothermalis TaxID=1482730 RepID=A0ABS2NNB4_9FIRM|nr:tRNA epoxyqueuosine(34) reductase QueG [Alkaliphilus hydrothermalis]MBM7614430.1 epoxyqueuosine reductase [Alkaliphilus hydrothermalis]